MPDDPLDLPRRLTFVDFRRVPRYLFDVLVIGGGAAGATTALAAGRSGASVAVLCKRGLTDSNTHWAQGGMAAVLDPDDSFESHVADTCRVGCGLTEIGAVEEVVRGGPAAVRLLLECGVKLDRSENGGLHLMREGGHGHHRIVHAHGDSTGQAIQGSLSSAIEHHESISVFENTFVVDLLVDPDDGRVHGCLAEDERGELVAFYAAEVVLATGGGGQIFRETTNPALATGDGLALAFRAGASLRDLEFFQFHPTCLYIAGAARVLISEIVRGAGGVLRDKRGQRFMPDAHPDAELAPRDVVSRAVFRRMVETGDTNVYLDLSEVEGDPHARFPGISRICRLFGMDIAKDPVPVRPGAHYFVGGIRVDLDGRTDVPGLWAVGECASTGVHGANRMGSNSLLEAIVLGSRAGDRAGRARIGSPAAVSFVAARRPDRSGPGVEVNIQDVTYSLKSLMWRQMGIERERAQLEDALEKIDLWSRAVWALAKPGIASWELLNMLLVSRISTFSALSREESRGVHHRVDFPEARPEWQVHTVVQPNLTRETIESMELDREDVGITPAAAPKDALQPS